jgi:hypothetical protein
MFGFIDDYPAWTDDEWFLYLRWFPFQKENVSGHGFIVFMINFPLHTQQTSFVVLPVSLSRLAQDRGFRVGNS